MGSVLLTALLTSVSAPCAQAVWLGRLDPRQLLGSWYVLAVASGEKGFAVEKATKNIEGVVVTLTAENNLKMLSSRHRLERCDVGTVLLRRQNSGWVFENPSLGVLDYRVLGTNFRDYAIVFTQLEFKDEAFSTVELYSRTELASQEAVRLFTRWSRGLGFLSQQQAVLQRDRECPPGPPPCPRTGSLPLVSGTLPVSVSQAGLGAGVVVSSSRSHLLPGPSQAGRGGPVSGEVVGPSSRLLLSLQSPARTRPSR
uniref:Lipocalin/cytosolic fatty-acid binding domain-containing protein n=1 Tax=Felis catus TaxID=9685 RepID=A0ABI8AGD5_FELCA